MFTSLGLAAAWAAIKGIGGSMVGSAVAGAKSNTSAALVVAGVVTAIVLVVVGIIGVGVHDRRIAEAAVEQCEAEATARALEQKVVILETSVRKGEAVRAERDGTISEQRARIEQLEKEQQEARDASAKTHDPAGVVFRTDDPWWMRGRNKGGTPNGDRPRNR